MNRTEFSVFCSQQWYR